MPSFSTFEQGNYSCLTPFYYNDFFNLNETFPDLFEGFMNGDFIVKQSKRKSNMNIRISSNTEKYSISISFTIFVIHQSTVNIH